MRFFLIVANLILLRLPAGRIAAACKSPPGPESPHSMAGVNVQAPIETSNVKPGRNDDANQPRVHTSDKIASSSSSSSSQQQPGPSSRRVSTRRPDGSSEEMGPSELRSLEQALRRESIVDVLEIGPLTVPSTPVRESVDGVSNDVRINLELASVKLSKLAPGD